MNKTQSGLCLALALSLASGITLADKKYGPGVTDTEIKIGQTYPYSGPLSAYATIARTEAAIFAKLNAEGGINGRKINFISLDDGYNPAKTVEQTRRLIEQEQVLLMFNPLGTPTNLAVIGVPEPEAYPPSVSLHRRFRLRGLSYPSLDHGTAAELSD